MKTINNQSIATLDEIKELDSRYLVESCSLDSLPFTLEHKHSQSCNDYALHFELRDGRDVLLGSNDGGIMRFTDINHVFSIAKLLSIYNLNIGLSAQEIRETLFEVSA